jgi:hypothetical protein
MALDNTSILAILLVLVVLLYLSYGNNCNTHEAIDNSGALSPDADVVVEDDEDDEVENDSNDDSSDNSESTESDGDNVSVDDTESASADSEMARKMVGRNSSLRSGGKYKRSSYKHGKRGGRDDAGLDEYFKNNLSRKSSSDEFAGYDQSGDNLAQYIPGKGRKSDDMFNSKDLLPKEKNDEWFETHNNVKVKNSHLINVYRPIGANTVSGTLRNPTYDFRGDVANPRYVVSPWNQSTIDPDINNVGLCKA